MTDSYLQLWSCIHKVVDGKFGNVRLSMKNFQLTVNSDALKKPFLWNTAHPVVADLTIGKVSSKDMRIASSVLHQS